MRLALLTHPSLPLKYLYHSIATSVHIINRLPSSGLPKYHSPYHALYMQLPIYHSLKVFGCACFPFTRPYNIRKLEFRSQECIYFGVSSQHKGHKCLNKDSKIFVLKDVVFHELNFAYPTMFPGKKTSSRKSITMS